MEFLERSRVFVGFACKRETASKNYRGNSKSHGSTPFTRRDVRAV
jgi:hypothetical protein